MPTATTKKTTKSTLKPVKVTEALKKSELVGTIAERVGVDKKTAKSFLENFEEIIAAHLKKRGPGVFNWSGVLKISTKKIPAKKARKGVNPFTGEETTFKAKPASVKLKISALKNLKEQVA